MLELADLDGIDRIVSIDAETTGFAVPGEEAITRLAAAGPLPGVVIQLGCIELLRSGTTWITGRSWESLVNPDAPIRRGAIEIHGIRARDLQEAPRFPGIRDAFEAFVGDAPLLAHDARNEIAYLNHEMRRAGLVGDGPLPYGEDRFLDTQRMGRSAWKGGRVSLDRLCDLLWIDRKARFRRHGALLDADLTAEVFIRLAAGEDPSRHPLMTLAEGNPPPGNAMAAALAAAMARRA